MSTRFSLFFILFLGFSMTSLAQAPNGKGLQGQPESCADQFAGNVSFSNFVGISNDIWGTEITDTIFLCANDQFDLALSDVNLSGDPDMSTAAGVGYALYFKPPVISGTDVSMVRSDAHYMGDTEFLVATGCVNTGELTLKNTGELQDSLKNGHPICVWYAPITYDSLLTVSAPDSCIPQYENGGTCVHVNIDDAFPVVYLNEIALSEKNNSLIGCGCQGSFKVTGGLPEYIHQSRYDIVITKDGDPAAEIFVALGQTADDYVRFQVPGEGAYIIKVSDGKSCDLVDTMYMQGCPTMAMNMPDTIGLLDSTLCLPVTVKGFANMSFLEFTINWDSTVLAYEGITPYLTGLANNSAKLNNAGQLKLTWVQLLSGITVADYASIFDLCLRPINSGSSTVWIGPSNHVITIADYDASCYGLSTDSQKGQVSVAPVGTHYAVSSAFKIQPNPALSSIEIVSQNNRPIDKVLIYNLLGQVVLSEKSTELDVSFLPKGVYSVQVMMGELVAVERLVKE